MEKKIAIKADHVSVSFGKEPILKNINMTIYHEDTIVIVGPSGGGKSVLLKTLAGLYKPSEGHVECEGEDWQNLRSEAKRKLSEKIGVQFQKSALFDSLTVAENVAFPIREHHPEFPDEEVLTRVQRCLESVGLLESKHLLPHEISGGMKQRLAIARAIALNPDIVFYDDPTAGLDPINSDKMAELILNLKEKYKSTLIVITHDMARAYQMAGRIFLVANNEVIETGSAEETRHHPDPRVQQFIHGKLSGPLQWG